MAQDAFGVAVTAASLDDYERFLPGGAAYELAREAVEALKPTHLAWELSLRIPETAAPGARLDGRAKLGWTSWLTPEGRDVLRADARLRPVRASRLERRGERAA